MSEPNRHRGAHGGPDDAGRPHRGRGAPRDGSGCGDRRPRDRGERSGSRGGRRAEGRESAPRAPRPNLPRQVAWEVLCDVAERDAYANLVLPGRIARAHMQGPDAGMTTELTYGTLRAQGFYDAIISVAADRPAESIDLPVLAAMRMGAHQLLSTRIAPHAAVKETVGVIRASASSRAAGFVNAVLRRIGERDRAEWAALVTEGLDERDALALTASHPQWIARALRQALSAHGRDPEELGDLLAADNTPAAVCLTALPGAVDRDALARAVGEPTPLSPIGVALSGGSPAAVPEVAQGRARVQDEGSQLVALALLGAAAPADRPGSAWLDMCAGPGGKTAILAAAAQRDDRAVEALDSSEHRADLVRDSTRAFADRVRVDTADAREFGAAHPGEYARVLVDVPCSGLGALRRRPEARWRRSAADLGGLGPIQRDLLAAGFDAVAPGGVLAYTTCSPHLAETLLVVGDFARKRGADVEVLDAPEVLAEVTGEPAASFASGSVGTPEQGARAADGTRAQGRAAQLWPHVHGTDGMFLTLLRKPAAAPDAQEAP
ncbi:RsmB/NOP family class I SAM-dependent RNA methyltransferase [Brevibacterium sp. BRM-1]|uniref:RsmB/NOP family class I SAM-dependent RNA methyltransferase n=1 Tax=Brevibacterium sp. BRM-1 TaxID=2999062 RepID=UPI00227F4EFF|nr:RsmB/NOP family class I SAM-dependent RNA methyltransferase [Brevibacterium sp. BRM-1]WAL40892.1 RsmB/NOP family class I SAM-dependent RNA methyltransferase [Brevibacterium sp. BRM-1]